MTTRRPVRLRGARMPITACCGYHRHAKGPAEAFQLASREYMKLSNQVTGGAVLVHTYV